jgi:low affinity Fe/Cu permease
MTIEEKLDEILSLIKILDTRIQFVQSDIDELKTGELYKIRNCVEQLAQKQLEAVQTQEEKNWVVERL